MVVWKGLFPSEYRKEFPDWDAKFAEFVGFAKFAGFAEFAKLLEAKVAGAKESRDDT
jgi:hypothetical protein